MNERASITELFSEKDQTRLSLALALGQMTAAFTYDDQKWPLKDFSYLMPIITPPKFGGWITNIL